MQIEPFKIDVPEATLEDLKRRLDRTRWPDEIPGSGWNYGSNLAYVKELVDYWRTSFDWRAQEEALNRMPQFLANVGGSDIHFVHEKGKGPNPMPLVITHGWPGSFWEMQKILPMLTDPASHGGDAADAFDVVLPSLPGYGFSGRPQQPGMHVFNVADLWAELMTEGLDYPRFAAQGGDWGAAVTSRLGFSHPDKLVGIHITLIVGSPSLRDPESRPLSETEQAFTGEQRRWRQDEGGYGHIQGTKPQTLSYGLNDSPAGLASWIVEKFRSWSDCEGDLEKRFSKDELLTNITIYWVTQTINSSTRFYYEFSHKPWRFGPGERVNVPCAVALFPEEINSPPREWVERTHNVQRWTEMPHGGHFSAAEEPQLLAEDIRGFFRPLR